MANLRYSQIRVHSDNCINYIANKEKMISFRVHDVHNVLAYMGESESTERVYSFAHHCSPNPVLAAKQMELYRALYYENKQKAVKDKGELLGLHFFLSYSEEDNPSEEVMNEIAQKLCAHTLMQGFPTFGANHFDKTHKHTHFYACQYSATGKRRKMSMKHSDFNDLRKYANRLCVEHGLSIIDLPALRHNDPEYSAWIDGVIAGGNITVHPEREEHKGSKQQKASTRQIYYRHMKEREEATVAEKKRLTAVQLKAKKMRETYFWNFENEPREPGYPVSGSESKRQQYYAVRRYDEYGRERSLVELICILILTIYQNETAKRDPQKEQNPKIIRAKKDYRTQEMLDCIRLSREMNTRTPAEVQSRIADTGRQMNALNQEKARHENSILHHEEVISAWEQYQHIRPAVEGVPEPNAHDLEIYQRAYAVLARNQVLSEEAFEALRRRYQFEQRKVSDYEKRIPELKRQYRELKKLENLVTRPGRIVDEIYLQNASKTAQSQQQTLDDQIREASQKKIKPARDECDNMHSVR